MFRHATTTVPRLSGAFEPECDNPDDNPDSARGITPTRRLGLLRRGGDHAGEAFACPRHQSGILGFIPAPSGVLGFVRPLSDQSDEILDPFDTLFVFQPSGVLITPTTPSAPLRGAARAVPSGYRGYQSTSPSSFEKTSMKPRTVGVIPPRASMEPRAVRLRLERPHPVDAVEPPRVASGIPSRFGPRRPVAATPPAGRTRPLDHRGSTARPFATRLTRPGSRRRGPGPTSPGTAAIPPWDCRPTRSDATGSEPRSGPVRVHYSTVVAAALFLSAAADPVVQRGPSRGRSGPGPLPTGRPTAGFGGDPRRSHA